MFCHLLQYKCAHSLTHSKNLINEAKTCLTCDKFGYRSRMIFLDKNEVIPFQKCPWNAKYKKIEFVKNIPFFKTKYKDFFFNQTPQHNHFCALNSLLML